jgi:hypothetical protein
VLKGPPVKLTHGLARTKTTPTSAPTSTAYLVSCIRVRSAHGNSLETKNRPASDVKEIAKFKQADNDRTCTSTSSILGYYHLSRALGDIALIAPAVIRTMDFDQHGKIVTQALAIGKVAQNRALKKSWSNFTAFKSGSSQNLASLFTVDNSQIFGALVSKDHGTAPYKDWITDANTSQTNIAGVSAFRNVTNPQSAAKIIGSQDFTQSSTQSLLAMRDMSDMLLIDSLMQQNDRTSGGNIHAGTSKNSCFSRPVRI